MASRGRRWRRSPRRAGFTRGAIYKNFDGKEDLFFAVIDRLNERVIEAFRAIAPERRRRRASGTSPRWPTCGGPASASSTTSSPSARSTSSTCCATPPASERSQAETWFQAILFERPDWAGKIALHHGSLDRKIRQDVETLLSRGKLRCVVSTSSLDLGVDFTPVDRVLQVGSPKGVARLIQRAGRSGHQPGAESRITCVPTHALELIEVAAARDAVRANAIESRYPVDRPLDVLAQHLVTAAIGGGFQSEEMFAEVRTTNAYRDLSELEWRWVIDFITTGGPTLRAYPEYSRVVRQGGRFTVVNRTVIRRHRMAIGTIVSDSALTIRFLTGGTLGTIEESYISRMKPGERFIFAGKPLEFVRVKDMVVYVRRARKLEGAIPRWMGSRMPLSTELAAAIGASWKKRRAGSMTGPR